MVSPEITQRIDEYKLLMRELGAQPPEAIIARLRESQTRLLSVLEPVALTAALWKPARDEWCLRELTVHAAFTERLVAKLVHHAARSAPPPAEDLRGAGIGMMPEGELPSYAAALDGLRAMNEELVREVRALPDDPDTGMRLPHPIFGPLNCLEWAVFQCVHDTDHLQHAERIRAAIPASV
jgi:hypothetical protein